MGSGQTGQRIPCFTFSHADNLLTIMMYQMKPRTPFNLKKNKSPLVLTTKVWRVQIMVNSDFSLKKTGRNAKMTKWSICQMLN